MTFFVRTRKLHRKNQQLIPRQYIALLSNPSTNSKTPFTPPKEKHYSSRPNRYKQQFYLPTFTQTYTPKSKAKIKRYQTQNNKISNPNNIQIELSQQDQQKKQRQKQIKSFMDKIFSANNKRNIPVRFSNTFHFSRKKPKLKAQVRNEQIKIEPWDHLKQDQNF